MLARVPNTCRSVQAASVAEVPRKMQKRYRYDYGARSRSSCIALASDRTGHLVCTCLILVACNTPYLPEERTERHSTAQRARGRYMSMYSLKSRYKIWAHRTRYRVRTSAPSLLPAPLQMSCVCELCSSCRSYREPVRQARALNGKSLEHKPGLDHRLGSAPH